MSAKLERHIERLPDYAEQAQRKLRKYFPATESTTTRRASDTGLPRPLSRVAAEVSVLGDVKSRWDQWNAPAARHARRIRRTSRAVALWFVLTVLAGLLVVAGTLSVALPTGMSATTALVSGIAGVVVFGTLGGRSGLRLRTLRRAQVPASPAPTPLPPASSAARAPMERLTESEATLTELLNQLGQGDAAVPADSVEDARNTAAEAASTLRALGVRIQAVERARDSAPNKDKAALEVSIDRLRTQLDDGLTGYGELVAAAGRAVAESDSGLAASRTALTDATDHLAGLALALKDLGN